jgi:anhydro-N-acetylmuramic acid kinase
VNVDSRSLIGLASGSSADGVDATLLEANGVGLGLRVCLLHSYHQPYSAELRELIGRVTQQACAVRDVALLHRLLGETFATAARSVADRASHSLQQVFCVGCPGHTVWHDTDGRFPSTLTLGIPAVVAERLGITVVSDFQARDVAAGGKGVPLAALTDCLLHRHATETRAVVHLGGIARIVFLPAQCRLPEVIGFEAGPCSALLDALMRQLTNGREAFDPGGRHAVQGRCLEPLLAEWLSHPYFARRPPKSLPRQTFAGTFAVEAVRRTRELGGGLHDLLCTATHFAARGITLSLKRFLPPGRPIDRILFSGGGVRNGLLWNLLAQQLPGVTLTRTDEVGVPSAVRKALSFGMLSALTLDGVAANLPSATGASGSRLLGSVTPGAPVNWSRCLAWMAAMTPMGISAAA